MGWMGSDPPPPPDYAAAAQAQGAANVDAARATGRMSNPNVNSAYGSRTVTWDGDTPTINETLSPAEQGKYDTSSAIEQQGLNYLQQYGMPAVQNAMSGSFTLPGGFRTHQDAGAMPTLGQAGQQVQGGLDYSGAPQMPSNSPEAAQQAQQAQYSQGARYLDTRYAQQDKQMATQLANQGIAPGSEAYKNAMQAASDQKNRDYGDLSDRSILAGNTENNQQFQRGLAARSQGVGETTTQGQFANSAQGQIVDELLSRYQAQLGGQNQDFNQGMANANLENQGRQANLTEMQQGKLLPLNVMNALLTSGQVNTPQFQQFQGSQVDAAPIFSAAVQQGNANNAQANRSQSSMGQGLATAGTIAAAFI